jgi:hypothetical protein
MALIIVFMPVITRRRFYYYLPLNGVAGGAGGARQSRIPDT